MLCLGAELALSLCGWLMEIQPGDTGTCICDRDHGLAIFRIWMVETLACIPCGSLIAMGGNATSIF